VVAPGVIDNHCHYDAQITWDPLCTYSCYHGANSRNRELLTRSGSSPRLRSSAIGEPAVSR
jgi:hypothetical protein